MVHRDEYRQMLLAGTVSFPATFPQVGKLALQHEKLPTCGGREVVFLSVTESPSARVTLIRRVLIQSVRAVFVPRDPRHVSYSDGEWLLGEEILSALSSLLDNFDSVQGIAFVPENEPSMLTVSAGMTAGESVQYYPPLPNDPAHNHYNAWPASTGRPANNAHVDIVGAGSCMPLTGGEPKSCEPLVDFCEGYWACASADEGVQLKMQSLERLATSSNLAEEAMWSCNGYCTDN